MNTFNVISFKTRTSYKLMTEGEVLKAIEVTPVGGTPVLYQTEGKDIRIENTVFRIGTAWRYIGTNDEAVRTVIKEMMDTIPTPEFAFV